MTASANDPQVESVHPATQAVLELHYDPAMPTVLDGAWFPRTDDAAAELTELVAAFNGRDMRINLLMLNPDGWQHRPRRVDVDDRSVRIAWFDDLDAAVLIATTDRYRRLQLLVVPSGDPASFGDSVSEEPPTGP